MSTASYTPSYQEWGVLNVLWRQAMFTARRGASSVMNASGARPSDLGSLADMGYICATRNGVEVDAKADDQWWTHSLSIVTLRLSAEGLHWVCNNKLNIALHAIEHGSGLRGARVDSLARDGIAQDEIARLAGKQLVVVKTESGGEVSDSLLDGHGKLPGPWLVLPTRRGLNIVGA